MTHECFANDIQELRIGRLSSMSGKSSSRSSSRSSLQSSPLRISSFSSRRVLNEENTTFFVRGASSPCNGNHFLVMMSGIPLFTLTPLVEAQDVYLCILCVYMCVCVCVYVCVCVCICVCVCVCVLLLILLITGHGKTYRLNH